jgi:hypothetical protein
MARWFGAQELTPITRLCKSLQITDSSAVSRCGSRSPSTARVLLVTVTNEHGAMGPADVKRLWSGLSAVPLENRDIAKLITDGHGMPAPLGVRIQALAGHALDKPDAFA